MASSVLCVAMSIAKRAASGKERRDVLCSFQLQRTHKRETAMQHRQGAHPKGKPMHKQPFPTVTRVGNMIFSSALSGTDLATGELPKDAEKQIEHAFANVKACVEEVGGTVGDIGKMVVYLADRN